MALNPQPTAFGRFFTFDFGDFGWHKLNNQNWEVADSAIQDLQLATSSPPYTWTDTFFDISGSTPPTQVIVNDIPAARFPDGSDTEAGALLILPVGFSLNVKVSLRLKLSTSSPGSGQAQFSIDTRINGGPVNGPTIVNVTPPSAANQHETVELFEFGVYELAPEDTVLVKVKRVGSTDPFAGGIDLYTVMMTTT